MIHSSAREYKIGGDRTEAPLEKILMSKHGIITQLTPEQKALIPVYREKWRSMALDTEPCDRSSASAIVKAIYTEIGLPEPNVIFFDKLDLEAIAASKLSLDPGEILARIDKKLNELWQPLTQQLAIPILDRLESELIFDRNDESRYRQWLGHESLWYEIWCEWLQQISNELGDDINSISHPILRQLQQFNIFSFWYELAEFGSYYDFCISVLNCEYDRHKWELYQALVNYCGWIFPFYDFCIVGDRPRKISVDASLRLHAEGKPAIVFSNGLGVYVYHGVRLAEKYGKLYPHQWPAKWLLSEQNAEIRRVLIQGIGYNKICQELQATELDFWREYTLLRIDLRLDEPIHLLKMTCPSTGNIHALRVPPNIKTARVAIRWVNWGIDPEEFAFET